MTLTSTAAPAGGPVDEPAGLRRALAEIDRLGWDSQPGDAVLAYAYAKVVGPAVGKAGLTGSRAADAASVGWVAAWHELNRADIRRLHSPWGRVASVVRRAILEEEVSADHQTNPRLAWRLARVHRVGNDPACERRTTVPPARALGVDPRWMSRMDPAVAARPVSLDRLVEDGWEPRTRPDQHDLGPRLTQIVAALVRAGWSPTTAHSSVSWIVGAAEAAAVSRSTRTAELPGWRELAQDSGLPNWQTRRLAALLLGYRGTPGLILAMVHDGDQILHTPEVQRGLHSTLHRWVPSPCAEAAITARPTVAA
jgi:hypothetical protein